MIATGDAPAMLPRQISSLADKLSDDKLTLNTSSLTTRRALRWESKREWKKKIHLRRILLNRQSLGLLDGE
jgi:hypothetical protein